jgi:transposase-like protein
MPKKKLSSDDALALVLSGLKGEVPVSDLCRKYSVSTATYYKLRDQFIAGGKESVNQDAIDNSAMRQADPRILRAVKKRYRIQCGKDAG